jgi:small subunit ribosomal protein S18
MACYFCQRNIKEIDYKNTKLLSRFVSGLAKIKAKKRTGVCSTHQRKLAQAIKRARFLALLPYTIK